MHNIIPAPQQGSFGLAVDGRSGKCAYYGVSGYGSTPYLIVKCVSNGENIPVQSGRTFTIDGQSLSVNDIVVLKDQLIHSQNGVWSVQDAAWTRYTGYSTSANWQAPAIVLANSGTANAGKFFQCDGYPVGFVVNTHTIEFKENSALTNIGDSTHFTVPAGVTQVFVTGCGAGGNGYAGTANGAGGGGGGGGELCVRYPLTVVPGTTYTIGVGAGVNATIGAIFSLAKGSNATSQAGGAGGNSGGSTTTYAVGVKVAGAAGGAGSANETVNGSTGGSITGAPILMGGNGFLQGTSGTGSATASGHGGGGGGSLGGGSAGGQSRTGGTAGYWGSAGQGGQGGRADGGTTGWWGNGGSGLSTGGYGGGGGGGSNTGTGGTGGYAVLIIEW